MAGESDLSILIRDMKPVLNPGEFVFCLCDSLDAAITLNPLCTFQEQEGVTVVLPRQKADEAGLPYSSTCAWITLTIHSSLEAVGLTSAVAAALTRANISCNVVAAYYHDHLFIPVKVANRAMEVLLALTGADHGQ